MNSILFPEARGWRLIWPAICVLMGCAALFCASPAWSQTQPAPAQPQQQSEVPASQYNPTKPEAQPNLSQDRDPVLSPDAADNLPVVITPPATVSGPAGQIQKGKGGIYTLRENVDEVILHCTVVDEKKHVVDDLKQGDFRVWEDGAPQAINAFEHQDVPVSMGILIDNSGSMHDKRSAVNDAALELIRDSNSHDEMFIVNFSDKAYLDTAFTSNVALLQKGLDRFDSANTTALYDAVVASADELSNQGSRRKQVLLVVTDGADNASRLTLQQAARRVERMGGPVVYSIGLLYDDSKAEAQQARDALETLSADTGGIAYFPTSLDDVNAIAADVARDIRDQYTLGYHSTRPARLGGFRSVRVEAYSRNHKKLVVRTSRGYYPNRKPRTRQIAQAAQ